MPRRKRLIIRRTAVPASLLRLLGAKIQFALQAQHIRSGSKKKYTVEAVCIFTGIPYDTMNSYISGRRQINVSDLRDIAQYAEVTIEDLMSDIPSRKKLDEMWAAGKFEEDDPVEADEFPELR